MAVAFVNSSRTGQGDSFTTSCAVPVPAGAAADYIGLVAIEQWESSNPTVTPPAGFTEKVNMVSGSLKLKVYWKRLTGADSGNWTFTWTGSQWNLGHAMLVSGAITSGDPISDFDTATVTSTNESSITSNSTGQPFLAHFVANENTASQTTPPTSFTETQDSDYLKSNYRIPGTTGSHTVSGGVISASTLMLAAQLVIEPDAGAAAGGLVIPRRSAMSRGLILR